MDLESFLTDCTLIKKPMTLNKKYYEECMKDKDNDIEMDFDHDDPNTFWVSFVQQSENGTKINGKARLRIDVLPADVAKKNPVGKARDSPNHSPFLPAPEGRMEFSLNPVKMFNQLVGAEVRQKILRWAIIVLVAAFCVLALQDVFGTLIA